jgi:hypothetical protein
MALFRNLFFNLRNFFYGVLDHASAQSLDFLDLAEDCSFLNWKLKLVSSGVSGWKLARITSSRQIVDQELKG